jgi:hypothetical protein
MSKSLGFKRPGFFHGLTTIVPIGHTRPINRSLTEMALIDGIEPHIGYRAIYAKQERIPMGFLSAFTKRPLSDCQHSVERFSAIISAYLSRLETKGGALRERSLTLIARSPSASVARALIPHAKELEREQVCVQLIFAKLSPIELLAELASALNLTAPRDDRSSSVRLIKSPSLLHAHEQLVLGGSTTWTGDMLRRCEENRNGLDLLEENAPGSVRLAQFAFNAIWAIAKPVPTKILGGGNRLFASCGSLDPSIAAAGLAADNTPLHVSSRTQMTRH